MGLRLVLQYAIDGLATCQVWMEKLCMYCVYNLPTYQKKYLNSPLTGSKGDLLLGLNPSAYVLCIWLVKCILVLIDQ